MAAWCRRLFPVDNTSTPPRTQMNDQNFDFYLPDGAEMDQGMAKRRRDRWVDSAAVPQTKKSAMRLSSRSRPGTTQFQLTFHMPYNGRPILIPNRSTRLSTLS